MGFQTYEVAETITTYVERISKANGNIESSLMLATVARLPELPSEEANDEVQVTVGSPGESQSEYPPFYVEDPSSGGSDDAQIEVQYFTPELRENIGIRDRVLLENINNFLVAVAVIHDGLGDETSRSQLDDYKYAEESNFVDEY